MNRGVWRGLHLCSLVFLKKIVQYVPNTTYSWEVCCIIVYVLISFRSSNPNTEINIHFWKLEKKVTRCMDFIIWIDVTRVQYCVAPKSFRWKRAKRLLYIYIKYIYIYICVCVCVCVYICVCVCVCVYIYIYIHTWAAECPTYWTDI